MIISIFRRPYINYPYTRTLRRIFRRGCGGDLFISRREYRMLEYAFFCFISCFYSCYYIRTFWSKTHILHSKWMLCAVVQRKENPFSTLRAKFAKSYVRICMHGNRLKLIRARRRYRCR